MELINIPVPAVSKRRAVNEPSALSRTVM